MTKEIGKRELKLLATVIAFALSSAYLLWAVFTGDGGDTVEYAIMLAYGASFALFGAWISDLILDLKSSKKDGKEAEKLLEEK